MGWSLIWVILGWILFDCKITNALGSYQGEEGWFFLWAHKWNSFRKKSSLERGVVYQLSGLSSRLLLYYISESHQGEEIGSLGAGQRCLGHRQRTESSAWQREMIHRQLWALRWNLRLT